MTHRRAGFTLLELVVALAVSGMAMGAGYAALAGAIDRRDALLEETRALERRMVARTMLEEWIDGARLDPLRMTPSFRGLDLERAGVPDDAFTFLTGARTPLGVARTAVTLRIERDSSGSSRGLVAELLDWDGGRSQRVMLVPGAEALEVRYLSGLSGEEPWLGSWISASMLPAAVELTLGRAPGDTVASLLDLPILVPVRAR